MRSVGTDGGVSSRASGPSGASLGYRPALDGVRAIAVLSVIGYHFGLQSLPGGFLGVDIFFVLSGYLITALLLNERARTGRIDFGAFWARRARRLLPAVLLLLTVVAVVIWRTASAATLPVRRDDMVWTLLYGANWHFIASDQSYFDGFAGASPLRHAWSLAIEEQFYLVWPLVVAGLLAWLTRRRWLLVLTVVGSIASAIAMATTFNVQFPSRAYYGTDTHAHNLLIGAALAVIVSARPNLLTGERAKRAASWTWPIAAVGIALGFGLMHDTGRPYYLGAAFAFAVVVAVGIWAIEAKPQSVAGRALSIKPIAWIGKISYGLYLWHWPFTLWITAGADPSAWDLRRTHLLRVLCTFAAATASYYLVEQPIRRGKVPWLRMSNRRLAVVTPVAIIGVLGVSFVATHLDRSSLEAQVLDSSDVLCPAGSPGVGKYVWCAWTDPGADAPVVATIGDSTARALHPGMMKLATERRWRFVQAAQRGCSIIPLNFSPARLDEPGLAQGRSCRKGTATVLDAVAATERPDVWVISDHVAWRRLGLDNGTKLDFIDARRETPMVDALHDRLALMTKDGSQVVIFGVSPDAEPLECVESRTPDCDAVSHTLTDPRTVQLNRVYKRVAAKLPGRVVYVSADDILCPEGQCPAVIDGRLARRDGIHFTGTFSRTIAALLVTRAEQAGVQFVRRNGSKR